MTFICKTPCVVFVFIPFYHTFSVYQFGEGAIFCLSVGFKISSFVFVSQNLVRVLLNGIGVGLCFVAIDSESSGYVTRHFSYSDRNSCLVVVIGFVCTCQDYRVCFLSAVDNPLEVNRCTSFFMACTNEQVVVIAVCGIADNVRRVRDFQTAVVVGDTAAVSAGTCRIARNRAAGVFVERACNRAVFAFAGVGNRQGAVIGDCVAVCGCCSQIAVECMSVKVKR